MGAYATKMVAISSLVKVKTLPRLPKMPCLNSMFSYLKNLPLTIQT